LSSLEAGIEPVSRKDCIAAETCTAAGDTESEQYKQNLAETCRVFKN